MASQNPEDDLPSSGLTYALGIVLTIVLIAIAAVAYVVMQPGEPPSRPDAEPPPTASTPQPPPPEAFAPSLMTLTSTPEGAKVFAGPLELGTTPVSLDMLEPGKDYTLRLEMEGYANEEVTLSVDPTSGETERNVVLEKE